MFARLGNYLILTIAALTVGWTAFSPVTWRMRESLLAVTMLLAAFAVHFLWKPVEGEGPSYRLAVWLAASASIVFALFGSGLAAYPMILLIGPVVAIWFVFHVLTRKQDAGASARWQGVAMVLVVFLVSVFYRWLVYSHLEQTSALFVGIPAILAVLLVVAVRPKSAVGILCKGTAVALLVAGMFLGEGFVCILMSAPIFFAIAIAGGKTMDVARKRGEQGQVRMLSVVAVALLPMAFEGTQSNLSFSRDEVIRAEAVFTASPEAVRTRLAEAPDFSKPLPPLLRIGYPRPVQVSGTGRSVGNTRTILLAGGEGKPGELVMRVEVSEENRIVFRTVSDRSHIAHWLAWQESEVEWQPVSPVQTRVIWTIRYRRLLDPAWYFGPLERDAVRRAAAYLIEASAEPRE